MSKQSEGQTVNLKTCVSHEYNDLRVVIILDHDPNNYLNNLLKETMNANKQYTLGKFNYLFEKSFSMRYKPVPIEFTLDREVIYRKDIIVKAASVGSASEFATVEVDNEQFKSLYVEKSKVKSWLTIRRNLNATTTSDPLNSTLTTPYKENARLIMHFENAYYREHSFTNNNIYSSNPESKFGRFPIRFDIIE